MKRLLIFMIIIGSLLINAVSASAQGVQCLFGGFPDETNTHCQYRAGIDINISYPLWLNDYPFALEPVQDFLQTSRDDFWNFGIESLDTMFAPWSLEISYEEYSLSDTVKSVVFLINGYSGGAHPYHYRQTYTFDLATQQQITLMDLFQSTDPLSTISPIVQQDLTTQMAEMGDAQWIADGTGTNPDNYQRFALTNDALIFFFDEYQVAPYAAGAFQVAIPLDSIGSILAPQFQSAG